MRHSCPLLLALGHLVLVSPVLVGQNSPERGTSQQPRRVTVEEWDVLWTVGGMLEDTLLLGPVDVVVGEDHVYVIDFMGHRVTAFDRMSGTLAWIAGREGSGPGELRNPRGAALAPDGDLLVNDFGNGRLVRFRADGSPVSTTPVPTVLSSMCPLEDGGMIGAASGDLPLVRISRDGTVQARYPLPWQDARHATGSRRRIQTAAVPSRDGCVLADQDGSAFAFMADGQFSGPYPYIERSPVTETRVTEQRDGNTVRVRRRVAPMGAHDIAIAGNELAVVFRRPGELSRRVIDLYDLGTGEYHESYVFTHRIWQLACYNGTFYIIHDRNGAPALSVVRPRRRGQR